MTANSDGAPSSAPDPADTARAEADRATLRRLIAALIPDLRAYARFLARDRAGADDLVQEALVRALAKLDTFHTGMSVKPWLFTVLRNAYFEQARRHRTERAAIAVATSAEEPAFPAQQEDRHALGELQRFLWQLPALQREALVLIGAQGLDYEEAAAICCVPVGTMKARVSRARARMQVLMRGEHQETRVAQT
jgi:RNA polymerase sigma-70 factor, ECF subfamily